jgi:hypothetical protein
VGVLEGVVKFPSAAPYVGLGFGTPARGGHFMFAFDMGAVIAQPTLTLTATGAASNALLDSSAQGQIAKTQQDVDKYVKLYPVLTLGWGTDSKLPHVPTPLFTDQTPEAQSVYLPAR